MTDMLSAHAPLVDSSGRPTPAFFRLLQQLQVGTSASMPSPAPVTINVDYTGTLLPNQLPATVQVQRFANGNDVSAKAKWTLAVASGSITASIAAGGIITITAFPGSSAVLEVRSDLNGVPLFCNVTVAKAVGSTPSGGSGGASATCTTFNTISSTSNAVLTTSPLVVTVGASGIVNLTAPLNFSTTRGSPAGDYATYGHWQYNAGSGWVDVAAEVQSSPDCIVTQNLIDPGPPAVYTYPQSAGTLTVNGSQGGLTPGASVQFQLLARNAASTRAMTFSGTASAVPQ